MKIDRSHLSVVGICEQCEYRCTRPTAPAAWAALALHAKTFHGDKRAAARARDAARGVRRRAAARS